MAAVELFAEQGVAGTTVAEIAARAGVTSAMVHYYFKTKDQLLDAVVEEKLIGQFIAFIAGGMAEKAAEPSALTEGLVLRIVEGSDRMPWLPPLWPARWRGRTAATAAPPAAPAPRQTPGPRTAAQRWPAGCR